MPIHDIMDMQLINLKNQIKLLDNGWQTCLEQHIHDGLLNKLETFLSEEKKKGKVIFPTNFFRALSISNFYKISVVLLGQDPYHGQEKGLPQANGLAFSVHKNMCPPPSLKNILKELAQEYPEHFSKEKIIQPCLDSWAKQGVLLLNTILSVEKMNPASHRKKGWEIITDTIISELAKKKPHLVFLLWGNHAQRKIPKIIKYNSNKQHLILTASHPSPFSAHKSFFGCNHFKITNQFLVSKNLPPIAWHTIVRNS